MFLSTVLVEGFFFFCETFSLGEVAFLLVSRLKEKVEPMVREKAKGQGQAEVQALHRDTYRAGSPPLTIIGDILTD